MAGGRGGEGGCDHQTRSLPLRLHRARGVRGWIGGVRPFGLPLPHLRPVVGGRAVPQLRDLVGSRHEPQLTPTQLRWRPERALLPLQPALSRAPLGLGRGRLERGHGRARRLQVVALGFWGICPCWIPWKLGQSTAELLCNATRRSSFSFVTEKDRLEMESRLECFWLRLGAFLFGEEFFFDFTCVSMTK